MLAAALYLGRGISFFGIAGPFAIFLAIVFFVGVVAISFKILKLLLPAVGVTEPWIAILTWLFILLVFITVFTYLFGVWRF